MVSNVGLVTWTAAAAQFPGTISGRVLATPQGTAAGPSAGSVAVERFCEPPRPVAFWNDF